MKIILAIAFVFAAHAAAASESFQASLNAALPAQPALYSFADVYRLTVSSAAIGGGAVLTAPGDFPIRVAVMQAAPAPETQFSIVGLQEPQRWLLFLSGLALATWVARRRLGYFF